MPLFKWTAFSILYLYIAIMVLAFIYCSTKESHSCGLTMQSVQHIRFEKKG